MEVSSTNSDSKMPDKPNTTRNEVKLTIDAGMRVAWTSPPAKHNPVSHASENRGKIAPCRASDHNPKQAKGI